MRLFPIALGTAFVVFTLVGSCAVKLVNITIQDTHTIAHAWRSPR